MATLILTTLGTALGGPIGGAIGGIIGQSFDQSLFGAPARRGPRLGDLSVQMSSYGTPVPRIYGRMRVAGTVIWASDLAETEVATGGGKGSAGSIGYAYSASFAVALSSRSAQSIGRIWADGTLLRGSDGVFKTKLKHRFYPGNEEQSVDPLIATVEGASGSPAFRGLAVAVFEDMALADYGNRIPSLTFELVADTLPPHIGAVISDISGGVIEQSSDPAALTGYAAMGSDRRAAIAPLVDLWGSVYHDDGTMLRVSPRDQAVLTIGAAREAGCVVEDAQAVPRVEREQEAADALPASLTIDYYDPDREFQAGQMRASLAVGGRSQQRLDSAAALTAEAAKALAHDALAQRWAGRDRITLRLAPGRMAVRPGQWVEIDRVQGLYRVEQVTIDGLVTIVEARRIVRGTSALPADAGRSNRELDVPIGGSLPLLFDLPAVGSAAADAFGLTLAIGCGGRFKPTAVSVEANGHPLASLRVERAAITGVTTSRLENGATAVIDRIGSVEVALTNLQAMLFNADDDALAMGANTMLVGAEIVQFGRALALSEGRYRLSNLLRGRRGTEWAVGEHAVEETVVLFDPGSLTRIAMDPSMIGAEVAARAFGIGDDDTDPPQSIAIATGESLRPLSPCHLRVAIADGAWTAQWVPRQATAFAWSTGDAVEAANFVVTVRRGNGVLTRSTPVPTLTIAAADIDALGSGAMCVEVVEQAMLPSHPAAISIAV